MTRSYWTVAVGLAVLLGLGALPEPVAAGETVTLIDRSRATRCAEEDNVDVRFEAKGIRRFQVSALPPVYLPEMKTDQMAADFTDCDMTNDPSFPANPRSVRLFEAGDWRLMGHAYGSFWRPASVPVRVGDRTEEGLHLLQLIHRLRGQWIEVLVLYPADGYWRAKPLPPARLRDTGYGSSFLVGPIDEDKRPFVALTEIVFDPKTRSFALGFVGGGRGHVTLRDTSPAATVLDVTLDPAPEGKAFAALRSMFVAVDNADVAELTLSRAGGASPDPARPVIGFGRLDGSAVRFGRSLPSRHNTSAPDMRFGDFGR